MSGDLIRDKECEISLALNAFDAVIADGEGAYLAGPISTGKRFYDLLDVHKATCLDELIGLIGEEKYLSLVRWPNVSDGEQVARSLRANGVKNLINTGPIFVQGWDGCHYMDFCFRLLRKKVGVVYFHTEWAFSRGAVKEMIFCQKNDYEVLDPTGIPIDDDRVFFEVDEVIKWLDDRSMNTSSIISLRNELVDLTDVVS